MTPININFTPKNMLVQSAWTGPPATCPAWLRFSTRKKISGTEVRRTPDVKLRFVGFTRFVGFNFGHIHRVMFVVVIYSVKLKN